MKIGIIYTIEFECILNGLACLALFSIFCNFFYGNSLAASFTQKISVKITESVNKKKVQKQKVL